MTRTNREVYTFFLVLLRETAVLGLLGFLQDLGAGRGGKERALSCRRPVCKRITAALLVKRRQGVGVHVKTATARAGRGSTYASGEMRQQSNRGPEVQHWFSYNLIYSARESECSLRTVLPKRRHKTPRKRLKFI